MPSDASTAQVVITRETAPMWFGIVFAVLVDGQRAGTLANGGSLTLSVAPGRHSIVVRPPRLAGLPGSEQFWFDAEAGGRIGLTTRAPTMATLGLSRPKIWREDRLPGQPDTRPFAAAPATAPASASPASAGPARPPAPATSTVVEGSRYEVPLGDETRTVDNLQSGSSTTRVARLTREWARTCTVDAENITTLHGSAGVSFHIVDLKAEAELALRRTYSAATQERESFAEEVTLNIGPHTKSEIVFSWKEIRQKGVVRITGDGFEVQVPYEAVVGLTFDQRQIDLA